MPKKLKEYTLVDAGAATSDGVWYDVTAWKRIAVHLIFGVATMQIFGSNRPTKPANNVDDVQIGGDITSDTIYELTAKIKWIKVKTSAYTSGTLYAYAVGDETAYGM